MNQVCPRELYSYKAAESFWKTGETVGVGESLLWRALIISVGLWAVKDKDAIYHALIASLTIEAYVLHYARNQLIATGQIKAPTS